MAWNGLNESSILQPGQKLLLKVTPPTLPTNTPGPPTASPTASATVKTLPPTATLAATGTPALSPTPAPDNKPSTSQTVGMLIAGVGLTGLLLVVMYGRKKG
jgi:hypothetical protein